MGKKLKPATCVYAALLESNAEFSAQRKLIFNYMYVFHLSIRSSVDTAFTRIQYITL